MSNQADLAWRRLLDWSSDPDRKAGETYYGTLPGTGGNTTATFARPKHHWVTLDGGGKVHYLKEVIFRWNFRGGTRERPQISYVTQCSRQIDDSHPPIAWPGMGIDRDPGPKACKQCLRDLLK